MKKRLIVLLSMALLTGCGSAPAPAENAAVAESLETAEEEAVSDAVTEEVEEEVPSEPVEEKSEPVTDTAKTGTGQYDRTYLEETEDGFVYRMDDADLIAKYDELFADAFLDTVNGLKEVKEWRGMSFRPLSVQSGTKLNRRDTDRIRTITTGSDFTMDYEYDLNNIGYTYADLDSDGTVELIMGVLPEVNEEYYSETLIERAYALTDEGVVRFLEGGSRSNYWLGSDGYIYQFGSGGAMYSGISRKSFDSTIISKEGTEWGDEGFTEEEYLGYWEVPVHISDGLDNMSPEIKFPDDQISEDELATLTKEWESRHVVIDWLKMSDYMEKYMLVSQ